MVGLLAFRPGGRTLLPHHQAMLDESGISHEVATARGYFTATTKAELERLGFALAQRLVPALVIPVHSVRGEVVTHQTRPDQPRVKNGKPLKYETPAGSSMSLDVPPAALAAISDPSVPLFVTEGARKADAAVSIGLSCIALLGVWNWRGANRWGGKTALPEWESVALNGRQVYIAFDSDVMTKPAVHSALARLGSFLKSRGAAVLYVYLPAGPDAAKVGLDDYLATGRTVDDLLALAAVRLRRPPGTHEHEADAALPAVIVHPRQMRDVLREVHQAVHAANSRSAVPELFQRHGNLVTLTRHKGALEIKPVDVAWLHGFLVRNATWQREGRDGPTHTKPDKDVAADLMAWPPERLPQLEVVGTAPVYAADGTLLAVRGYHASAAYFLDLTDEVDIETVVEAPTSADLSRARQRIEDVLLDFPFRAQADQANVFAALLQPLVRRLITGPTPLYLIEAPGPGTGKGLVASVISLVTTGREAPRRTLPSGEDEVRKALTAELAAGRPIIVLDNAKEGLELDSQSLASILTADEWTDRLLGASRNITVPNAALWLMTGNNPRLTMELTRRCVRIRIDANQEQPWRRETSTFKYPDLIGQVKRSRALLWGALLTMVNAWFAVGRPRPRRPGQVLGTFESWSEVIGGILECAGVSGFLANAAELYAANDSDQQLWRDFVAVWAERFNDRPRRASDLVTFCREHKLLGEFLDGAHSPDKRLGRAVTERLDQVFGTHRIEKAEKPRGGVSAVYYCLRPARMVRQDRLEFESAGVSAATNTLALKPASQAEPKAVCEFREFPAGLAGSGAAATAAPDSGAAVDRPLDRLLDRLDQTPNSPLHAPIGSSSGAATSGEIRESGWSDTQTPGDAPVATLPTVRRRVI